MSKEPGSGLSAKQRQLIRWFIQQNGLCWWCRRPMCLVVGFHVKDRPKNMATFEHMDSRLSPNRGDGNWRKKNVAACRECNERRAASEQRRLPIEELHRRAGNGHAAKGLTAWPVVALAVSLMLGCASTTIDVPGWGRLHSTKDNLFDSLEFTVSVAPDGTRTITGKVVGYSGLASTVTREWMEGIAANLEATAIAVRAAKGMPSP